MQRSAEIVSSYGLHAPCRGLLRQLHPAQRRVLQVEGQLHHVAQVVPPSDVVLRECPAAVHFYCLCDIDIQIFRLVTIQVVQNGTHKIKNVQENCSSDAVDTKESVHAAVSGHAADIIRLHSHRSCAGLVILFIYATFVILLFQNLTSFIQSNFTSLTNLK